MTASQLQYKVFMTPLIDKDEYGDIVDVTKDIDISELVRSKGIGNIKSQVDNGDYEFGIFTYSDLSLQVLNRDGRFSIEGSYGTIFKYKRDLTKVKIEFRNETADSEIVFEGVVNEEATREDLTKGIIKFKILSKSSIFRKVKVTAATIPDGTSFKNALFSILNNPEITSLLNIDINNIELGIDLAIDNGSALDNKVVQNAINELLVASSSVLYIDDNDNVIITTRANYNELVTPLYGGRDVFGRENILKIKNYNNGLHRLFNSIEIGGELVEDPISINNNKLKRKSLNFDFITDQIKKNKIGARILDDFRNLRQELEIEVRTKDFRTTKLLDNVVVNLANLYLPSGKKEFYAQYGVSKYGQDYYANINNPATTINFSEVYRIIAIVENAKKFTTTFKIRGTGLFLSQSGDNLPTYGSAVYGEQVYQ